MEEIGNGINGLCALIRLVVAGQELPSAFRFHPHYELKIHSALTRSHNVLVVFDPDQFAGTGHIYIEFLREFRTGLILILPNLAIWHKINPSNEAWGQLCTCLEAYGFSVLGKSGGYVSFDKDGNSVHTGILQLGLRPDDSVCALISQALLTTSLTHR